MLPFENKHACPSLVSANLANSMLFQNEVTIRCDDNQNNDFKHNDTQHNNVTPSIMTFSITLIVSTKRVEQIINKITFWE